MASFRIGLASLAAAAALIVTSQAAQAASCLGVTFGAAFTGSYNCNDLGQPGALPSPLGGLTFLDNDTLLIGGAANQGGGVIRQIDVVRDANNHITGFAGPSTAFATAPNIDGGLSFGPGGVLFATGYSNNTLLQWKPGSTSPDRIITLPSLSSSVGALAFVPAGFAGAGQMKVVSYSNGNWFTASLTPDGNGTYDVALALEVAALAGGPEGMVYIDGANAGFGGIDSLLVAEWGVGKVATYEIDGNGDPIQATRRDFLSGLSGAEGAVIDPLTGDFLFSTFGGGDRVLVISGFAAPDPNPDPQPAPEPGGLALVALAGAAMLRAGRRRHVG
ncbi:MAG: hypothetical protein U1F56_14260 [Rubrivivax sp.]